MRKPPTRHRSARADFVETLESRLLMANRIHGVDVSQWQGLMDWNKAWDQNVRFAFVRASRTNLAEDPYLDSNLPNARARGILAGPYHYVLPMGEDGNTFQDPIVDAQRYIAAAGQYMAPGYLRPVVDVESQVGQNESFNSNGYNLNTWVAAFINEIKRLKPGVNPLVYTGSWFAQTYLNSTTVAASPDLWIANYSPGGDPVTDTTLNPIYQGQVGTGPWRGSTPTPEQSWDFWQYSADGNMKGALYGSPIHNSIDLDVFNGDDINVLKQNFVIGAAKIPTGASPSNGASGVNPGELTLDWADSQGAAGYDVYVNGALVASNLTQSQWSFSSPLTGGATYQWRVVAKGLLSDPFTHVSSPAWSFTTASIALPGVPSDPNPHGTFVSSKPVVLDWADTPGATHYDVYLGIGSTPTFTNLTASQTPGLNFSDGNISWRVVAKNGGGSTSGPQWSFTLDTTPPSATYGAQTPTSGSATFDFTVTYSDFRSGVDFTSLDSSDIVVTGPNGYSQSATLVSLDANANGSTRIATYRIDAPGGSWDAGDNGTYSVNQNADQVKDLAGAFRPAGAIGTFEVNFTAPPPTPFAYMVGSTLHVDFDGTAMPIALSHSDGTFFASRDGQTLEFTGVDDVVGNGTDTDDLLHIASAVPAPLTFNNGQGNDSITVTSGTFAFNSDLSPAQRNIDLTVAAGATAVLASSQHLKVLTIAGEVTMIPDGSHILAVKDLIMTGAGSRLDLADNDLVIDYAPGGASPIGTSNGNTYSGITGLLQSGRNGGAWNGLHGIRTSQQAAADNLTTLGIAEAAEVLTFGPDGTALFGGETVDATAVLIKYTWAGDANLDGFISGDDYTAIDFAIGVPNAFGHANGDFNYDGIISGDDYTIVDFMIAAQGAAL